MAFDNRHMKTTVESSFMCQSQLTTVGYLEARWCQTLNAQNLLHFSRESINLLIVERYETYPCSFKSFVQSVTPCCSLSLASPYYIKIISQR